MNLGTYLDEKARKYRDKPLLFYYDHTLTYGEFARQVDALAHGLKSLGFRKGDFIHVLVQNSPETLISYFAIQKIGCVAGPINAWWKAPEIEYLLNDSKGRGLIIEPQYLPVLDEIRSRCPHLEIVVETGESPREGHQSYNKLISGSPAKAFKCTSKEKEAAYIFYTSGTTGNPKGVLLSHRNVFADVRGAQDSLNLEEGLRILIFLPLFHVNAMMTSTATLDRGGAIVLRKAFSASEFWSVVEKFKVNYFSAVPAVYQILLSDPSRDKYDRSSLMFGICGAAPMPVSTFKEFEETFKIPIVEGYGLTEATCASTLNPRDGVRKVGSIGLAMPGQEVLIVDEDGKELPAGERGEIVVRGDVVMMGYFNRPDETAEAVRDGVLHTGDVGYKDEDGYIFIVDRIKDMVIRGGENIYPKEIDNVLAAHPNIADAATIGVPDNVMGEEVKAFIIARDPSLTEEEVREWCRKHLAEFKIPKYVEILDEDLPRNALGKVMKKVLKQWGLTPRPKQKKDSGVTVEDIFNTMEGRVNPDGVKDVAANFAYLVTGEGGGEWTVCVKDGKVKVLTGVHEPTVTSTITAKDWIDLTLGKLDGMTAFTSGRLKIDGDLGLMTRAARFFKKYVPPAKAPEVTVEDIFNTMEGRVNPEGVKDVAANFAYLVTGEGGGEWTVCVKDGKVKVLTGVHEPTVTSTITARDWIALTLGKLDGMTAFTSGRLKVDGDLGLMTKAARFFKKYIPPSGEEQEKQKDELIALKQVLSIKHRFSTGPMMGRFLKELRDNKRILGNKCPKCGRLQTPPREACAVCKVRVEELVEVGPLGTVVNYDIAFYSSPDPLTGESRETPYCSAFMLLDGCRGTDIFWHEIKAGDIPRLKEGARVRPVWSENRNGSITDIKYFEIVDDGRKS
jgi:long-chain acyl-CoA synthetase